MNSFLAGVLLAVSACVVSVHGYSSGAPSSVCNSFRPGGGFTAHGSEGSGSGPFSIVVKKSGTTVTSYEPGQAYSVVLQGSTFKGFMASSCKTSSCSTSSSRVGSFSSLPSGVSFLGCGGSGSTVTHNTATSRTQVTIPWTAPASGAGTTHIKAVFAPSRMGTYYFVTTSLPEAVAATFSAAIDSDNLVTMTFSEAVHRSGGGEPVSSSFNVTVDPPLDVAVVAVTAQSTSVFILNVTFSGGVPSGTQHVSVDVVPSAILTTSSNLAVGAAPARLLLHERVPPSFVASVGAGNVVAVNFTEDVSSPDGALVASDLLPALVGGSATLLSWNLTTLSPRDYALTLLLLGQANGSEVVTVAPVPGRVLDAVGNAALGDPVTAGQLVIGSVPNFTISVALSNTINVTFDQQVFGPSRTALNASAFVVTVDGATQPVHVTALSTPGAYELRLGQLSPPPAGGEVVAVDVAPQSVFSEHGVAVEAGTPRRASLSDQRSPTFSAFAQANGTRVAVLFSEGVQLAAGGGVPTVAAFNLTLRGGSATLLNVSLVGSGPVTWTFDLELSGSPDGTERVVVDVLPATLADSAGNLVLPAELSVELVDVAPRFTVTVLPTNALRVEFSEPVTNVTGGALSASDFFLTLVDGKANWTSVQLVSLQAGTTFVLTPAFTSSIQYAALNVSIAPGTVVDTSSKPASAAPVTVTLVDTAPPSFTVQFHRGNLSATVTFTEPVLAAAGGNLTASAFGVAVSSAVVSLAGYTLTPLEAPPHSFVLILNVTGTPAGAGVVTINVVAAAVVDNQGNAALPLSPAASFLLPDRVAPTLVAVQASKSTIVVNASEPLVGSGIGGAVTGVDVNVSLAQAPARELVSTSVDSLTNSSFLITFYVIGALEGVGELMQLAILPTLRDAAGNAASPHTLAVPLSAELYTVTTVLQPSPEASLSFRLRNDGDVADFRFAVNTTAWIGIGFNTQAAMVGSDAVVAQPSSNEVQQYELGAKSLANVVVDPQQGVFNTTLLQAGGWTIMRFSRHLAANGTGDVPIRRDGSTPVVWAYGASNAFMQHTARGVASIDVRQAGCFARTSCSGHGTCNSSSLCTCDVGYAQASCSVCQQGFTIQPDGSCLADSVSLVFTLAPNVALSSSDFGERFAVDVAAALGVDVSLVTTLSLQPSDSPPTITIRIAAASAGGATVPQPLPMLVANLVQQAQNSSSPLLSGAQAQFVDKDTPLQVSYTSQASSHAHTVQLSPDLEMAWSIDQDSIAITLTATGRTWIGIGFMSPKATPSMVVDHAVIAMPRDGTVKEYTIASKSAAGVVAQQQQDLTSVSLSVVNGDTIARFTRPRTSTDAQDVDIDREEVVVVYAWGVGENFGYHAAMRGSTRVNFVTGSATPTRETARLVHGVLMFLAWCVFIPLGTLIAKFGRHVNPDAPSSWWFSRHRALQVVGVVCVVVAVGFIKLGEGGAHGMLHMHLHNIVGWLLAIVALFQPLNAVLRPGHGAPRRACWEFLHKGLGWVASASGLVVVLSGLLAIGAAPWMITAQVALSVVLVTGTAITAMRKKKQDVHQAEQPAPELGQSATQASALDYYAKKPTKKRKAVGHQA